MALRVETRSLMARVAWRAGTATPRGRVVMLVLAVLGLVVSGLLSAAWPPAAQAAPAAAAPAAGAVQPGTTVKAGTNLLLNPQATAGDVSAQGWDTVTIPGWQIQA